jgi:hypothetical protein
MTTNDLDEVMTKQMARLEENPLPVDQAAMLMSIAISMKRIADHCEMFDAVPMYIGTISTVLRDWAHDDKDAKNHFVSNAQLISSTLKDSATANKQMQDDLKNLSQHMLPVLTRLVQRLEEMKP